jgi:type I restriction enzyme S subunit
MPRFYQDVLISSHGVHIEKMTFKLSSFMKLFMPVPPLPEQTKIADILTTVDDKISSIDSKIQQTEQLKKGLMEKLLTEGIGHKEFKETEIGRIPVGWEVITIGQIVKKIVGGGTPSRERFDYYNGDIPWITVKDLASNSFYKNSAIEHISEEGLQNSSANLIHCENIIIATRMGLGRGFINTIDMAINQDMKALYLDREKVSNRFFLFWYLSKSSFIETLGTGTTVKGISLPTLKKLALPFPPLPEQKQIATILSTVDDKLDIMNQKKSHYQTLKKGLSQQLLTGQMRVKV